MTRLNKKIRNFGIIAHVDAGKTTVAEQMLFRAGVLRSAGRIDDGNTSLDFSQEERDRGITIESAATRFEWSTDAGHFAVNFIDTPGHVDFTVEVERALSVLDGAIAVISAVSGVEPQTETVWRQADRHDVPRIVFVNKLDLVGADFDRAVRSVEEKFGVRCAVLQDVENELKSVVNGENLALIDTLCEHDASLTNAVLNGEELTTSLLWDALARTTEQRKVVPVLAGSALKGEGIEALLDAAVTLLPAPAVLNAEGTDDHVVAVVFKQSRDPFAGRLSWVRVHRGALRRGDTLVEAETGKTVRIGRLVRILADRREQVDELEAGEVGAVIGLDVASGATLCCEQAVFSLDPIVVREPVVWMNVEAKNASDRSRLSSALNEMTGYDPSLRFKVDSETGETLIGGQGELQLEVVGAKLRREFEVDATFGQPLVAFRETITREATINHRLKKQTGGPGMFAEVAMIVMPAERGSGVVVRDESTGGAIPAEFVKAWSEGVTLAAEHGRVGVGHPIEDVLVTLTDGMTHKTDSSARAFERCGYEAFRSAVEQAAPVTLVPMMSVTVTTPDTALGDVIGELERRRSTIVALSNEGASHVVDATTPLSETFGLSTTLRSVSKGRAQYSAHFSHFARSK